MEVKNARRPQQKTKAKEGRSRRGTSVSGKLYSLFSLGFHKAHHTILGTLSLSLVLLIGPFLTAMQIIARARAFRGTVCARSVAPEIYRAIKHFAPAREVKVYARRVRGKQRRGSVGGEGGKREGTD